MLALGGSAGGGPGDRGRSRGLFGRCGHRGRRRDGLVGRRKHYGRRRRGLFGALCDGRGLRHHWFGLRFRGVGSACVCRRGPGVVPQSAPRRVAHHNRRVGQHFPLATLASSTVPQHSRASRCFFLAIACFSEQLIGGGGDGGESEKGKDRDVAAQPAQR